MCKTPKMPVPTALPAPQAPKTPNVDALRQTLPFAPLPTPGMMISRKVGSVGNGLIGGTQLLGGGQRT